MEGRAPMKYVDTVAPVPLDTPDPIARQVKINTVNLSWLVYSLIYLFDTSTQINHEWYNKNEEFELGYTGTIKGHERLHSYTGGSVS